MNEKKIRSAKSKVLNLNFNNQRTSITLHWIKKSVILMWKALVWPHYFTKRGTWVHKTNSTTALFFKVHVPRRESERSYICVLGVSVPSQESERSYICVLGVSVPSQESERSCISVLGVSVPSQESERSCISVLTVSIFLLTTHFLLYFGNVPTVWFLSLFFHCIPKMKPKMCF